jgi:hypothetical protein
VLPRPTSSRLARPRPDPSPRAQLYVSPWYPHHLLTMEKQRRVNLTPIKIKLPVRKPESKGEEMSAAVKGMFIAYHIYFAMIADHGQPSQASHRILPSRRSQ